MIGFVMVGTNDLKISEIFYDKILTLLGFIKVVITERYIGYAKKNNSDDVTFYITKPHNEKIATNGNGTMIAFLADSSKIVDKFHDVALNNGAKNDGFPGQRHGKDYYAYIRDPNDNKICVFAKS